MRRGSKDRGQLILFEAHQDVSLTPRDGRSDVVKGPEPGWELDWWLRCRDGSPWAASSTTKSRLGSTSTRSRFQVCICSDGDRSRMAMLVYLWLVCIMLSVVYLHGTYPPSRLWGLSEVQNLAKRDRPSILWGERDKRDGNLGSACRCRPSDAGRVYLTSHQVRWPARKPAGIHGCRCEQVGSLSEREGWMDSVREKGWSLAPLWPTWVGRAGWSQ